MAQQPRGRPPSQAPPPGGRGRNALTALGGGVLVLAVAGGAWALFGRDDNKSPTAIGPKVPTAAPAAPVFGPVAPGKAVKPGAAVTPTSLGPVAATASAKPAATKAPSAAPSKAAVKTIPTVAPTKAPAPKPVAPKPAVVTPQVTGPQQAGTVAKRAYTFRVARGDTLWSLTKKALSRTGRPTSNANVTAFVDKLYAQNRGVVGSNPNLIVPGQTIVWPSGL
ncbi:MAG: hypothetical protein JWO12_3273 [Frankiales bacterium]|nr:hypothetical protein [Frankiales bacterium]